MRLGCDTAKPIPPTILGQIDGKRVCGKRAPYNFLKAIRPIMEDEAIKCPDNYIHCGDAGNTTLDQYFYKHKDNIICVPKYRKDFDCPITSISFSPELES